MRSDAVRRLGAATRPPREFTAEQVIGGIIQAVREGLGETIGAQLLHLLASWYPEDYERLDLAVLMATTLREES